MPTHKTTFSVYVKPEMQRKSEELAETLAELAREQGFESVREYDFQMTLLKGQRAELRYRLRDAGLENILNECGFSLDWRH